MIRRAEQTTVDAELRSLELAHTRATAQRRREHLRDQRLQLREMLADRRTGVASRIQRDRPVILRQAQEMAGYDDAALWQAYFALGGNQSAERLLRMLDGTAPLDRREHDLIALALNEAFAEQGFGRPVEYWERFT